MTVHFVGAGPGDPELLTRKAERLLRTCRLCIYAGSLVSQAVLELLPAAAARHDSSGLTLAEIMALCTRAHDQGLDVVRLHSGDPSIFGAIGEQMNALDRLGIPCEVVPGVSSFQAAAAALQVELTAPEVAQAIILTRASGRVPLPPGQELERLAATGATLCVFLSVQSVAEVAATLVPVCGDDCPVAVVFHASRPDQQIVRGRLGGIQAEVAARGITRTAMIVVGRALDRGTAASRLYDPTFSHGYRKADP
jgi:precorrin-4/cobalt-precorrin-4 C11-methyltransferase